MKACNTYLLIVFFSISFILKAQVENKLIFNNIISRTNQIKYNDTTGSCFILDYEGRQYFLTAQHIIKGLSNEGDIEIFYQNKWQKHHIKLVGHSQYSDISIFTVPEFLNLSKNLTASYNEVLYSQELFFLGFPYGYQNTFSKIDSDFPLPFVKKAILSNFINYNKTHILFLDGINNPGFSGGPIVFYNYQSKQMELCGIISGFQPEIKNTTINDSETQIQYSVNTGIIIGYGLNDALEIIKSNPIGVKL